MKTSKIPGLGRFGVFIDDLDLDNISDEEWIEIGKIHLETLVTILRNVKLTTAKHYENLVRKWGPPRHNRPLHFYEKYGGKKIKDLFFNNELDEDDRGIVLGSRDWLVDKHLNISRVTARKNEKGKSLGLFDDGELKWHSNECADVLFTPGVALLGRESMIDSCTGFVTTVDWYEEQTESFRSELDQMIVVHNYEPGRINPVYNEKQEAFYRDNSCPYPNARLPLVIKSPVGIKGIHLGINTFDRIEGMAKEESDKLFKYIEDTMFVDKYIYKHWYQQDNDLLLFDNSITLHNREIKNNGTSPNRLAWRTQFDYDNIAGTYQPYYQQEFNDKRNEKMELYLKAIG